MVSLTAWRSKPSGHLSSALTVISACSPDKVNLSQGVFKQSAALAGDVNSIPGWEDPLEEEMATHPSILAWRIPIGRGA